MQSVRGFVTLIVFFIGFLPADSARACDCIADTVEHYWENATAVFVGEIRSERLNILPPLGYRTIQFRVLQSWKGITDEELVTVLVPGDSAACGPGCPKPGERFLVFATADESQTLWSHGCDGTGRLCPSLYGIENAEALESLGFEPLLEDGVDLAELRLTCETDESSQDVNCDGFYLPLPLGFCGIGSLGPILLLTTLLLIARHRYRMSTPTP